MGTRADFYVGTGEKAEWLGSVAWDGYEWDDPESFLMKAKTEQEFRDAVKTISKNRDDWTSPEQGWPWPWEDSCLTDYTYYFMPLTESSQEGIVSCKDRNDWPNMEAIQNVTWGKRSGIIIASPMIGLR